MPSEDSSTEGESTTYKILEYKENILRVRRERTLMGLLERVYIYQRVL